MSTLGKFLRWSQISDEHRSALSPEIPWRKYADLTSDEKSSLHKHFKKAGFLWGYHSSDVRRTGSLYTTTEITPEYPLWEAVMAMNTHYKKECYGHRTLTRSTPQNATEDFIEIRDGDDENIYYEFLSFYAERLLHAKEDKFGKFKTAFNDIFESYRINVVLTDAGFVPRQEAKILSEIFEPVLGVLASKKWERANRELGDAFSAFRKGTPDGYSESMTHCYTAIQAFLQELSGNSGLSIKDALKDAQSKKLIPTDAFSVSCFKEILSVFEQLRMKHGDAHPKEDYADEKTAKLMMNLTMIYLQHCLQV